MINTDYFNPDNVLPKQIPSCTILLSTYNGEKYLRDQIDSILNQIDVEIKIMIRDDGSSDGTKDILSEYSSKHKDKIRVFYGDNQGIHKSYAWLIDNVSYCDFLAFSDQDDVWDKDKIITAVRCLQLNDKSFYSSTSRLVDSNLNPLNKISGNEKTTNYYMDSLNALLTPGVQGCTIVMKYSFFDSVRKRRYPGNYGHDTWFTIVAFYSKDAIFDKNPKMSYRQHNNSWTGNRKHLLKRTIRLIKNYRLNFKRYESIAFDLMQRYCKTFNEECNNYLLFFSNLHGHTRRERISFARKYHVRKFGFFPDLMFKYYFLILKA